VRLHSKTGHILPGGTLRTIILEAMLLSSDGTERQQEQIPISAKEQNRLLPNEERTYIFDTLSSATGDTIAVRLMYQLTPKTPESEWILMAKKIQVVH